MYRQQSAAPLTWRRFKLPELTKGVLTALITPCDSQELPDLGAIRDLIDYQATTGVTGLFVLGTAGQGPMFTAGERMELLETIVDAVAGRLSVVAHIGTMPTAGAVALAEHAAACGADAVSSVPPVYYQPGLLEVADYYRTIKSAVGDTPILAYNNPAATGYDLRPDQAAQLHSEGTISGVKQASAIVTDLHALLAAGVPVWMANASCNTAALSMGAIGTVSTIANVAPEKFAALYDAVQSADLQLARRIQHQIDFIASRLRSPIIGALHEGVSQRGLPGGRPRSPLRLPNDAEGRRIAEAVEVAVSK